ncbi:alpha/beta-Hydrolases superfamily protein [Raphanus sativus]|nr:alpha/beta-Hydrolases superfamily protein [Raphanus sativus]
MVVNQKISGLAAVMNAKSSVLVRGQWAWHNGYGGDQSVWDKKFRHSMSGMIGCAASIKRPDLFTNLVLIAASPRYINSEDYKGGFEPEDIDAIISNIASNYEAWVVAFAPTVVDSRDSLSVQWLEKCLKKMKPETALALGKIVFGSDERELLGKVSVPCHIIQSGNDVVVPVSVAYFMQENIKGNSAVEIIENSIGHFPQMTSHLELLRVMRRLLEF